MPSEMKQRLDALKEELICRLRVKAPEETEELVRVMAALDGYTSAMKEPSAVLPYALTTSGIEAICDWLMKAGKPCREDEIVQGVLAGGFQLDSARRELNVRDSIRFHLKNPKTLRIRKVGRLIEAVAAN